MNTKSYVITGWRVKVYNNVMGSLGANRVYKKALALIDLTDGQQLIDIGCGTGTFLNVAREKFPKARFIGVDASEDMLVKARKTLEKSSAELLYADAAYLPFPNASCDFVISILTFHHLSPEVKIRAIQEISRILKKKGRCLIVDFGRATTKWGALQTFFLNWHAYTSGNMLLIEQELARCGLSKERQEWHRGFIEYLLAKKL